MAAVRFSDMQGKSHWMAICSCFCIPPPKRLPRLPPAGGTLTLAILSTGGRWPGKVSPGGPPRDRPLRGRRGSPRSSPAEFISHRGGRWLGNFFFSVRISSKQVVQRNVKVICNFYQCFIVCFSFHIFVSGNGILIHVQVHCQLQL